MKRKNILRLVWHTAMISQIPLLLSSCTEEQMDWLTGTPIRVTATAEAQANTRSGANNDIQTKNFDAGETLNAYFAITGGAAIGNVPTTLTASEADANGKNVLTPDVQPYYPNSEGKTIDIYALYPPSKVTTDDTKFEVEVDQTTDANYKLSDLMWAGVNQQAKTTADVNLLFSHKMAKMNLTITGTEGVLIQEVRLINTVRTINITPSTQTMGELATETDAGKKKILVAKSDEEYTLDSKGGSEQLTGAALFPPQQIMADFIEVKTNFGTTCFSTNKTFGGGTQYTADLTVTRQMIGFTSTITDWTSDGGSIAVPPGSSANIQITSVESKEFTGSAIELTEEELEISFPINNDTYDLVINKDYKCTYFNNINIGTATIIIEGLADPDRPTDVANTIKAIRAVKSFEITSAIGNISFPNNNADKEVEYEYNTTVENELILNGGDGTVTYESTDPTVAKVSERGRVTILKVGETTIKADMHGGNYSDAHAEYNLKIKPRDIKAATNRSWGDNSKEIVITLPYSEITYNGLPFTPSVVVTDKGRILQEGTHYSLEYSDNTNKGTATVTIKGLDNYYSAADAAAATKTFNIKPVTPNLTLVQDAVTLPIGQTVVRLGSTNYGTVTYSGVDEASYTNGAIKGISETGDTPVKVTATVKADSEHGNWEEVSKTISVTVVQSSWTYSYTGTVQEWTCPLTGVYKLEAYGAQGATCGGFNGGRGAYISGQLKMNEGDHLYIYVGQEGKTVTGYSAPYTSTATVGENDGKQGGWNGGGYFTTTTYSAPETPTKGVSQHNFCGGGGATDFALVKANWNTPEHMNSRILVAGGGGGALYREWGSTDYKFTGGGGSGGALNGEDGYGGSKPGGGGTTSSGGAAPAEDATAGTFGYGGNYSGSKKDYSGVTTKDYSIYLSAGMGGGGWYGGGSGGSDPSIENADLTVNEKWAPNFSRQGSGGGGSSYIYHATSASYPNGVTPPDTKYYITPTGEVAGASAGNGKARITYMGEEL